MAVKGAPPSAQGLTATEPHGGTIRINATRDASSNILPAGTNGIVSITLDSITIAGNGTLTQTATYQ